MRTLIAVAAVALAAGSANAETFKAWVLRQPASLMGDSLALMRLALTPPVIGYRMVTNTAPRDKTVVFLAKQRAAIAARYALPTNQAFRLQYLVFDALYDDVATNVVYSTAEKKMVRRDTLVRDRETWVDAYLYLQGQESQADNATWVERIAVYGDSPATVNRWTGITVDRIERILQGRSTE